MWSRDPLNKTSKRSHLSCFLLSLLIYQTLTAWPKIIWVLIDRRWGKTYESHRGFVASIIFVQKQMRRYINTKKSGGKKDIDGMVISNKVWYVQAHTWSGNHRMATKISYFTQNICLNVQAISGISGNIFVWNIEHAIDIQLADVVKVTALEISASKKIGSGYTYSNLQLLCNDGYNP